MEYYIELFLGIWFFSFFTEIIWRFLLLASRQDFYEFFIPFSDTQFKLLENIMFPSKLGISSDFLPDNTKIKKWNVLTTAHWTLIFSFIIFIGILFILKFLGKL